MWIPVPTRSSSGALIIFFSFSCLQGICMSRQSQILFLSDVGIFIVYVWCATQTRPRSNVQFERCSITTCVTHKSIPAPFPGRGSNPGRRRKRQETYNHYTTVQELHRRESSAIHSAAHTKRPYLYMYAICMRRQSQTLFFSDVGIFRVHVWCATQTRH